MNALNHFQMVRIPFEWFKFAFEFFESFQIVRICIRMLRILFELFQFTFESFKSLLNSSDFDENASDPFQMVRIWIGMLRMPFEWLEFASECVEFGSNV